MKKFILLFQLFALSVSAQLYEGGGGPNAFYKIPLTPRETALGESNIANVNGVFAPYLNPAGILTKFDKSYGESIIIGTSGRINLIEKRESYEIDDNSPIDNAAVGLLIGPWEETKIALNFYYRKVNDILRTELYEPLNEIYIIDRFNSVEYLVMGTIAQENFLNSGVELGINVKVVRTDYGPGMKELNYLAGLDIGATTEIFKNLYTATTFIYDRDERNREIALISGIAWEIIDILSLTASIKAGNFTPADFSVGLEFAAFNFNSDNNLFFRIGSRSSFGSYCGNWNKYSGAGIGIRYEFFTLDLAYALYPNNSNNYLGYIDLPMKFGLQLFYKL